jgi:DNA-binding CsgD family transcriptional regulator
MLVIEGEPGIGKTTLWESGLEAARQAGALIFEVRPTESEASLPFASLTDLLRPVPDEVIAQLPAPQRLALDVALARVAPGEGGPDTLTLALALLGLLRALAARGPVVLAIDDFQWVDGASRAALEFAVRRFVDEPVCLVATIRSSPDAPADLDGLTKDRAAERLTLGPLTPDALAIAIRESLGVDLPLPIVKRIHAETNGNPFFAVEFGRSLVASGARPLAGRPLPAPRSLRELLRVRMSALGDAGLEVVVVAAALARPRRAVVEAAIADESRTETGIIEAELAGILRLRDGMLVFDHPILASVAYDSAPAIQRQRLHRRLAALVPNLEERAFHLGLATTEPDPAAASELETAADLARRRGAPAAAAGLYEDARRVSPPDRLEDARRRGLLAAECHLASGDAVRARALLDSVLAATPSGPPRAAVLEQLATVVSAAGDEHGAVVILRDALADAEGDRRLQGDIHDNLAWMTCWLGDMPASYDHVRKAREAAEAVADDRLLARVLDKYAQIEFQVGEGTGLDSARRAAELERAAGVELGEGTLNETLLLTWADQLEVARDLLTPQLARAVELGDERVRADILVRLSLVEIRAGRWDAALREVNEGEAIARAAGLGTGVFGRASARVAAGYGDLEAVGSVVASQLPAARAAGHAWMILYLLGIEGLARLSVGDDQTAADVLTEAVELAEQIGIQEPGIFRIDADAIEALIRVGALEQAEKLLERFEARAARLGRRWAVATAGRCRALLHLVRSEDELAVAALAGALAAHSTLGQPFELARTLLVAGTIHRRAKRRGEARVALNEAIRIFDDLAAGPWLARARAELARIDGRAPAGDGLTATEARVAELVASGLSNKAVADQLFVSVRTVETNLTRIYQKLGLSSRTQLVRRMGTETVASAN